VAGIQATAIAVKEGWRHQGPTSRFVLAGRQGDAGFESPYRQKPKERKTAWMLESSEAAESKMNSLLL